MTTTWLGLSVRVLRYFGVTLPPETDFEVGVDAWSRGKYETALKEFRALANQGHTEVQFHLGVMYDKGQGTPQDYQEAVRWYRLAVERGVAPAQFNLGVLYDQGQGVPQDYQEAARWSRLAAEQGLASFRR